MKTLQKILMVIVLISPALYASGQTNPDINQILSKSDSRKKIMTTIANDSTMSKEMKEAMMNSGNGKMMMHGNMSMMMHGNMSMMKTGENHEMSESMMSEMMEKCKTDTLMRKSMMSNMMKACKSDTSMMSSMCKTMMGDKQMKEMMQKNGANKDLKEMDGMNKRK